MLPQHFIQTILMEMNKGKGIISDVSVKILIVSFSLKQLRQTYLTFFSVFSF